MSIVTNLVREFDPPAIPFDLDARRRAAVMRTTAVFILVLLAFYGVAQARTPRIGVLIVFIVYVVAATAWVRSQYAQARDGATPTAVRPLLVALMLLAVAAVVTTLFQFLNDDPGFSWGGLVLLSLFAAYLTAGYLILRSRHFIAVGLPDAGGDEAQDAIGWADHPTPRGPFRSSRAKFRNNARLVAGVLAAFVLLIEVILWLASTIDSPQWLEVALAGAGFVALAIPWLVSLLSEHVICALARRTNRTRGVLLLAGLLLFATTVMVVWVQVGWPAAVAILTLAALAIALASSTLADIAVVLAIIALMGVTPSQDPSDRPLTGTEPAALQDVQRAVTDAAVGAAGTRAEHDSLAQCPDRRTKGQRTSATSAECLLVILGDSYMSGEGAATYIAGTDEGGGNTCRRATTAWSQLAARQPPFTKFVSFACSGADTYNIRSREPADGSTPKKPTPKPQGGVPKTQLDEYTQDYRQPRKDAGVWQPPALVVLSVGGNDAGFATIGLTCLAWGDCNDPIPEALWSRSNLDRVENRLRLLYEEVNRVFPRTPIAVVPYPRPIREHCDQVLLSPGDVAFIKKFLPKLNKRIRTAAADYGFYVVEDVVAALARRNLQLCDEANGGQAGLNFIGLRSVGGLSEQRFHPGTWTHNSLHPNERGHAALHEAFQRWLNRPRNPQNGLEVKAGDAGLVGLAGLAIRLSRPRDENGQITPRPKPESENYAEDPDDCATWKPDDPRECVTRSSVWAAQQTTRFVAWPAGPIGLTGAAGAWLAAVAIMGWRRSRVTASAQQSTEGGAQQT